MTETTSSLAPDIDDPVIPRVADAVALVFAVDKPKKTPRAKASAGKTQTQAKIDKHLARLQARSSQLIATVPSNKADDLILQQVLPFFDDENRGVPNPFIRSGLFRVGQEKARVYNPDRMIASQSNYKITATGEELYQDDLTVWMSLLCMVKDKPLAEVVGFSGYQILSDIGWSKNVDGYTRVRESIKRLKATVIEVATADGSRAYAGSLLRDYGFVQEDGDTGWWVRFEPQMAKLLMSDTTTLLEWEVRKKIGSRGSLCQWLHAYYSSHKIPHPLKIQTIWEWCGSTTKHMPSFRRNVGAALAKLVTLEFLSSYRIDENDIVYVQKHKRFMGDRALILEAKKQ